MYIWELNNHNNDDDDDDDDDKYPDKGERKESKWNKKKEIETDGKRGK